MIAHELLEAEQASERAPQRGRASEDTGDALQALMDMQNDRKRRGL